MAVCKKVSPSMNLSMSTFKVNAESLLQVPKSGNGQFGNFHGGGYLPLFE